ncbi:MAG: ATP-binding protein, partial [Thermoanaerobaculia bacterium]|nr:ATP-binding protein [Thermoanaerobaculia bacterium]
IENARLVGALQKQIDEKERLRRQSEQILASSPVGIAVLDGEDRVILANRAFAELTGSDPEAVSGISLEKLLPVRPIPGPDEGTVEAAFCEPDGTERHLQLSTADFSGAGSGLKVLVAHDVTDKVTMEHALQEKERLAALGMLAAGLAHEVNTPITGISSYAQLLLEDTPEEDPRHALLEKMERQTFRASRIVNNLLEFARNRDHEARPLDLRRIVDEALETVTDRFDQAPIRVEWEPPAEPQTVLAGDGDLHQVLVNLIANGCDAMTPEGGTLRLGMESDDGNIRTRVEDDGVGIPPEQLDRIFEPFFSTKVGMGGTGLGLAISHQIVRRLGGTLKVESSPGEGTRFVLELPRHDRDSANRT